MGLTRWDQGQARVLAICARLSHDGVVEPLADGPDDEHAWNGWGAHLAGFRHEDDMTGQAKALTALADL